MVRVQPGNQPGPDVIGAATTVARVDSRIADVSGHNQYYQDNSDRHPYETGDTLSYAITGGNEDELFSFSSSTGAITLARTPVGATGTNTLSQWKPRTAHSRRRPHRDYIPLRGIEPPKGRSQGADHARRKAGFSFPRGRVCPARKKTAVALRWRDEDGGSR